MLKGRKFLPVFAIIILTAIVAFYIYELFTKVTYAPYMWDDVKCFLLQFSEQYLSGSLTERIQFLFLESNWPHPKISGRIASLFSYYFLGEINFFFLKSLSFIGMLAYAFLIARIVKLEQKIFLLLPVFLILLTHNLSNHWAVMMSRPISSIIVLSIFYLLSKNKVLLAGLLAFFLSFNASTGMIIFPLGFLFLVMVHFFNLRNVKVSELITWSISSIVSIGYFYLNMLQKRALEPRNDSQFGLSSIGELYDLFKMLGNFAFLNIRHTYHLTNTLIFLLFVTAFSYVSYTAFRALKNKKIVPVIFYFSLLHIISTAFIACVFLFDSTLDAQQISPRYVIYSFHVLPLFLLLIIMGNAGHFKRQVTISLVALLFCLPITYTSSTSANQKAKSSEIRFKKIIRNGKQLAKTVDPNGPIKNSALRQYLICEEARSEGWFNSPYLE